MASDLAGYELVVLADTEARTLPPNKRQWLEAFVLRGGRGESPASSGRHLAASFHYAKAFRTTWGTQLVPTSHLHSIMRQC